MENEMFWHMILYRFFLFLYNAILVNKIDKVHEVQTVLLKNDSDNGNYWELCQKMMEICFFRILC